MPSTIEEAKTGGESREGSECGGGRGFDGGRSGGRGRFGDRDGGGFSGGRGGRFSSGCGGRDDHGGRGGSGLGHNRPSTETPGTGTYFFSNFGQLDEILWLLSTVQRQISELSGSSEFRTT